MSAHLHYTVKNTNLILLPEKGARIKQAHLRKTFRLPFSETGFAICKGGG